MVAESAGKAGSSRDTTRGRVCEKPGESRLRPSTPEPVYPDFFLYRDDVEIRILHREAESLILGSRPTARPIAPSAPTKEASGHPGAKP
jgi:hypothetical protein